MNRNDLMREEKSCRLCPLREGCHQVVTGIGPSPCPLMLVGEAPGGDEDRLGEPFVGVSGKLLNRMLKSAELSREDAFISNVCRCKPPGNRRPQPDEIETCRTWLWQEMRMVDPLVVVAMGSTAAKLLLKGGSSFRITKAVGQPVRATYLREGGIIVPIFHPSYLLQNSMVGVEDTVKTFIKVKRYMDQHKDQ
jgi:uracil-DNA glycosylase